MLLRATWCGRALALSHARSGFAAELSGHTGKSGALVEAIADFSMAYAEQTEAEQTALERAVRKGKLKAVLEGEGRGGSVRSATGPAATKLPERANEPVPTRASPS